MSTFYNRNPFVFKYASSSRTPAGTTFKFKMKVLAVCLMAAALVGMVASTSLEKVEGETPLNVVEGEEAFSSVDVEVLKEGPGK